MKISEITSAHVTVFLQLESGDYDATVLAAIMAAAKQYLVDYTGIPATSADVTADTLDNHPDFYIAYMVLCQDMYDNRAVYVDKSNVNKVVETILGMHCTNLL